MPERKTVSDLVVAIEALKPEELALRLSLEGCGSAGDWSGRIGIVRPTKGTDREPYAILLRRDDDVTPPRG